MTQRKVAVFEKETGRIQKVTETTIFATDDSGGTNVDVGIAAGFAFVGCAEGVGPNSHHVSAYIDGAGINGSDGVATISERPELDVSGLPSSGEAPHDLALTGLPSGSVVYAINPEGQVAEFDGSDDLTLTDAGSYTLRILPAFPYLPKVLTVEVTAEVA